MPKVTQVVYVEFDSDGSCVCVSDNISDAADARQDGNRLARYEFKSFVEIANVRDEDVAIDIETKGE